ncbi:universal stress protein [Demequina zhanjiangensis]|uniref:Universal stress protein n=1 Tax=Demequina zhanjiangensis TaxID=3051659 RepID=A0ABT8FZ77_9MICO|nr:universal stress protein [Demequina sp. SYSU T00b26]MDN4472196.1 universal stress protein [Demequina sp. SYSU T00b26]
MDRTPPQPSVSRLPGFRAQPLVVGVLPETSPILIHAAEGLALSLEATHLVFAYVDPTRVVVEERADGGVVHAALDSDADDSQWETTRDTLAAHLGDQLAGTTLPWELHYLAGRADRALTHLARAVDASMIVVGSRGGGWREQVKETFEGSLTTHLSQHQHRPVVTVPLSVVDWKDPVVR